jgi:hypothetical protein
MSELLDKQHKFSLMIAKLIIYAYEIGYKVTLGEGYDDDNDGHMKGSLHYVRLAQDLNLFKGETYLQGKEAQQAHALLHDYWDTLGGAERISGDLNHYSIAHNGKR